MYLLLFVYFICIAGCVFNTICLFYLHRWDCIYYYLFILFVLLGMYLILFVYFICIAGIVFITICLFYDDLNFLV